MHFRLVLGGLACIFLTVSGVSVSLTAETTENCSSSEGIDTGTVPDPGRSIYKQLCIFPVNPPPECGCGYTPACFKFRFWMRQSPGVERSQVNPILLILGDLRSFNRGSFHAIQNRNLKQAGVYNPEAYPRCALDKDCQTCDGLLDSLVCSTDFLWWRACEEGVELGTQEYMRSFFNETNSRAFVRNRAHIKNPDFKYSPGFRIGIARNCGWGDFSVNWTHFHTKARVRGLSLDLSEFTDMFFSDWERIIGAVPDKSSGRFALDLDFVDVEFGRKFYISACFILRPQLGLRAVRIHQTYRVISQRHSGPTEGQFFNFISMVKSRSNFLSVGPRAGVDIEFHLCSALSLFGRAAGSLVFGKFNNHSREHYTDYTSEISQPGLVDYNENASPHRCSRAITDFAFGVRWDRCFEWCNRSHPVSLMFSWEHHAFWDMNTFNFSSQGVGVSESSIIIANGSNRSKYGDLYTQGLTMSVSFGF